MPQRSEQPRPQYLTLNANTLTEVPHATWVYVGIEQIRNGRAISELPVSRWPLAPTKTKRQLHASMTSMPHGMVALSSETRACTLFDLIYQKLTLSSFPLEVSPKLATKAYNGSMKRSGDSDDGEVSAVVAQATKRNKTKGAVVSSVSTTSSFNRGVSIGNGDIVLFMNEHTWWPCEVGKNLAHFGNSVNSLSENEIASLKAHTGSIAKIFTRDGESPRFYALSDTDELRFMTSADRAPRCATTALKEAFVEARHSILTNPTMNHPINSQQRVYVNHWEEIAANVNGSGGDDDDDGNNTQEDEDKSHVALSLLADASAGGRQTSLSEAAELMAAMKRQPEMTISKKAIRQDGAIAADTPSQGYFNEGVFQNVQENEAAPKQFAAI